MRSARESAKPRTDRASMTGPSSVTTRTLPDGSASLGVCTMPGMELLDLLERLSRSFFPVTTFEHDAWLEPLRDSPRFAEIMRAAAGRHQAAREVWEAM